MNAENLVAWLPFDESTTQDLCGNEWTAYGDPTISDGALQLNRNYLRSEGQITFGGQDFTINLYSYISSSSYNYGGLFCAQPTTNTGTSSSAGRISIFRSDTSWNLALQLVNAANTTISNGEVIASNFLNGLHHFELDYIHSDTTLKVFVDGQLTYTKSVVIERLARYIYIGCTGYDPNGQRMSGSIDNFMLHDGVALHTENFTPPTQEDYLQLQLDMGLPAPFEFDADTVRQVVNALGQEQTIHFDGNDGCYGLLPLGVLAGATTFTIEAKISTTTTANITKTYGGHYCAWEWKNIFGIELNGFGLDDGGLSVNSGKLHFWCSPASAGTAISNTKIVSSDAVVNDGKVHEVAAVSSNGAISLYCDGQLVAYADNINAKISSASAWNFAFNNNSNSYLQMDLYEARLWNVARTQEEIFATLDGSEQGLQAYYLPEVRTDNILPDISGNENHATLYGSAHVFPFDFVFDADTVIKIDNKSQERLTVWLPFNNYPTEDLCGNWWISTNPGINIHQLVGEEADVNHSVALYLAGVTDSAQGQLVLNCQGIYLGGKDFTISFDWWYGGAPPLSDNCPFGLWDENYSAEGSIYIYNYERFSPNWNLTSLRAFGQSTPDFGIQWRAWRPITIQYTHEAGTLDFYLFDTTLLATLEVTIPRTLFTHVEIDRAAPTEHGSGFISNLKISGGEMASDCANELIYLCVLRNGVVECYPFRAYEFIDYLALAIRYDGRNWYNVLRNPSDELASDFYILHDETIYALSKG